MRRSFAAALVGFLVIAGLQAQPASAASSKPAKVGLVSFVKADYDRGRNLTSLSLDWPDARQARKYEIFVSKSPSMKKPKVYRQKSSKTTIRKLGRGKDYYFQVRGVNGKKHGSKSNVVARTTIVRPGPSTNLMPLRILTYNVCSRVCDDDGYLWFVRQPAVLERIASSGADVVATQEADHLTTVPGYALAVSFSAKKLWYNPARFSVPAAPPVPNPTPTPTPSTPTPTPTAPPPAPIDPATGCRMSSDVSRPTGQIFLGRHGGGCRYAVWAELVERATGRSTLMVDVHTVSGTSKTTTNGRRDEINTLISTIQQVNVKRLPVIYAGDFNSHKQSAIGDVVRPPFKAKKFYDAFDLARRVSGQHINSFNGFKSSPTIGTLWGTHLDKVWVDPWKVRVDGWYNHAQIGADGKLVEPIPSDHNPIVIDVRIG